VHIIDAYTYEYIHMNTYREREREIAVDREWVCEGGTECGEQGSWSHGPHPTQASDWWSRSSIFGQVRERVCVCVHVC